MRAELSQLHRRLSATILYVTHDQVEAMTMGQRIAVMNEGRLQQCAQPLEVYSRPANLFVAGFIGSPAINLFAGELRSTEDGCLFSSPAFELLLSCHDPTLGGLAQLGVRPENLRLVDRGTFPALVRVVGPV